MYLLSALDNGGRRKATAAAKTAAASRSAESVCGPPQGGTSGGPPRLLLNLRATWGSTPGPGIIWITPKSGHTHARWTRWAGWSAAGSQKAMPSLSKKGLSTTDLVPDRLSRWLRTRRLRWPSWCWGQSPCLLCYHFFIHRQGSSWGPLVSTLGARDALVFVDGDDLPATMPGDGLQLAPLVLGGLLSSGDTEVEGGAAFRRLLAILELRYSAPIPTSRCALLH
jgi:hypothetical protein